MPNKRLADIDWKRAWERGEVHLTMLSGPPEETDDLPVTDQYTRASHQAPDVRHNQPSVSQESSNE